MRARSSLLLLAVAIVAAIPADARAQEAGETVRVQLRPPAAAPRARTRWIGTLERIDADSLVLIEGGRRRVFARTDVARTWVRTERRSRARGAAVYGVPLALLGGAAGWAFGRALEEDTACPDVPGVACTGGAEGAQSALGAAGVAAIGGLGALYGATHGRFGWRRVDAGRGASLVVTPSRVAVAIPLR